MVAEASWITSFAPWAETGAATFRVVMYEDSEALGARTKRRVKGPKRLRVVPKSAGRALLVTDALSQRSSLVGRGAGPPLGRALATWGGKALSRMVLRREMSPWGFGGLLRMDGKVVSHRAGGLAGLDRRLCSGPTEGPPVRAEWELDATLTPSANRRRRPAGASGARLEADSKAAQLARANRSPNTPTMNLLPGKRRSAWLAHISSSDALLEWPTPRQTRLPGWASGGSRSISSRRPSMQRNQLGTRRPWEVSRQAEARRESVCVASGPARCHRMGPATLLRTRAPGRGPPHSGGGEKFLEGEQPRSTSWDRIKVQRLLSRSSGLQNKVCSRLRQRDAAKLFPRLVCGRMMEKEKDDRQQNTARACMSEC